MHSPSLSTSLAPPGILASLSLISVSNQGKGGVSLGRVPWLMCRTYLFLSLSLSRSSIADCCEPGKNCVILGGGQAYLSEFPREAMTSYQPYPFGLDPVRDSLPSITYHLYM